MGGFISNEMTLEPGLQALLYQTRWEIETEFDEIKTTLEEMES
jgi:IS4 transposase